MTTWKHHPEGLVNAHGKPLGCVACGRFNELYEAQNHAADPIVVGDQPLVLCPTCFGGGHTSKVRGQILEAVSRELPYEFLSRNYPLSGRAPESGADFDASRHYTVRAVMTLREQRRPDLCWVCGRDAEPDGEEGFHARYCFEHRAPEPKE